MLKIIRLPDKPASSKNNSSKPASSKNNGNSLVFERNDNNNKIRFSDNDMKYTKKSEKLKSQKLAKF